MKELIEVFKSVFPEINEDTRLCYYEEFDGKQTLFEHSGSDCLFWLLGNFEYNKEKNILIEKLN